MSRKQKDTYKLRLEDLEQEGKFCRRVFWTCIFMREETILHPVRMAVLIHLWKLLEVSPAFFMESYGNG